MSTTDQNTAVASWFASHLTALPTAQQQTFISSLVAYVLSAQPTPAVGTLVTELVTLLPASFVNALYTAIRLDPLSAETATDENTIVSNWLTSHLSSQSANAQQTFLTELTGMIVAANPETNILPLTTELVSLLPSAIVGVYYTVVVLDPLPAPAPTTTTAA